jgi:Catalytic LigB subunit of aromatic ring-opening dioxygenase
MAKLVGTFFHSHGGTTSIPGDLWSELRSGRPVREDVPMDDHETNLKKAERTHEGFRVLRERIAELRPDVLVVFSDDQLECFDFNNYPAFAIFVGETFKKSPRPARGSRAVGRHAEPGACFKGHPEMGTAILTGVMQRGFDPAFCMDMPKPDRGIAGGIIRTAEELTDWQVPIVPVMMNVYFAPQPTGLRCYQFGKAVREVIDAYPDDVRVGVIASGGLWHTPNQKGAWLNETFDRRTLDYLKAGDAHGMAEYFESYIVPPDDPSQDITTPRRQVTGMPSVGKGPQFGSRETCTWISAAAVSEGCPTTIVDYIPVYASPVGNAFAYCDQV